MGATDFDDHRRRLGEAFAPLVEACARDAESRFGRFEWSGQAQTPEYAENRFASLLVANLLIARWLITGESANEEEALWLSTRGRAAAAANLAIVNVTRSYLNWRDTTIEWLAREAQRLGTPAAVLDMVTAVVKRSADTSLIRMSRAYDAEMARVMRQVEAERNAYRDRSLHDALTGLPNRVLLFDRMLQATQVARRDGGMVGVLLVDLDMFKQVNDNHGHAAGDQVLCQVGQRLVRVIRASDTVARLGGDEFVVLLPGCAGREAGQDVGSKIAAALADPISIPGAEVSVGCSVGCAFFPDQGVEPAQLLRAADAAMYAGKRPPPFVRPPMPTVTH